MYIRTDVSFSIAENCNFSALWKCTVNGESRRCSTLNFIDYLDEVEVLDEVDIDDVETELDVDALKDKVCVILGQYS